MKDVKLTSKYLYWGLFLVTLCTLTYEILLTRIFSVTMWYHYAFVAISIALFGMTVGAVLVYLYPSFFKPELTQNHISLSSFLFAVSIPISFLTHLCIPFVVDISITGFFSIALTYSVITIPFIFSGICVSLILARYPNNIGNLYAVDLIGAAVGCVLFVVILEVTDGPTAVLCTSSIASLGAFMFTRGIESFKTVRYIKVFLYSILLFTILNLASIHFNFPLLRLQWVKGEFEKRALFERWNSFSRIRIDRDTLEMPFGWGFSTVLKNDRCPQQLLMTIDATAGTVLTSFHGDYELLEYLKYDITNIVHYIRHHSKILIIGTGGGRDILSALLFQQKSIVGIEINKEIINAVNRSFANFTGCLDTMANVTFVHDEARSYIARSKEKFDIIQASLTDTWAATAVGAFCLTENSLYTVEGWKIFLDHLSPNGILTFSRWYFKDRPDEMHRLTSLAGEALRQYGFENPRNHIMIARRMIKGKKGIEPEGVGTMLVSKSPFSRMEIETIGNITDSLKFEVVLSPYYSIDYIFSKLTAKTSDPIFLEQYPLNISPPTDENPFFFHMFKLKTLTLNNPIDQGSMSFNLKAIFILIVFLVIVILLLSLCIILPLKLTIDKSTINGSSPFSFYFLTIGIGFMLIEISQMQRLNIFLGHPTYGLSVVLFSLLVSSSIGSLTTQKLKIEGMSTEMRLLVLCITLIVFGFLTPTILLMFEASLTPIRIIVAVLLLFPIGLFMGMAFPIGLKFATIKNYKIIPWLWGINGAASVFSSVLAVVLSISWSISITYWIGCICYIAALLIFLSIRKFLSLPLSL